MGRDKRQKQRIAAPIQLVIGEDNDLIDWYLSFPSGTRQQQVKDTLRAGLGLPVQAVQPVQAAAAPVIIHSDSSAKIAALEAEIKQLRAWNEQWYAYIQQQLAAGGSGGGGAVLEAVEDRLSDEQMAGRKDRLKKAKW